jgi:hypothetical protein
MAGTLVITTLSDGTNSTSATNCIQGSAKAWVKFVGNPVAINGSFNVSSVTRASAGVYTVNFTTAMPNANYAFAISGASPANAPSYFSGGQLTTALTVNLFNIAGGGVITSADASVVSASVFSS